MQHVYLYVLFQLMFILLQIMKMYFVVLFLFLVNNHCSLFCFCKEKQMSKIIFPQLITFILILGYIFYFQ